MELLAILLVLLILAAFILPWVNMVRITSQGRDLERLKRELSDLQLSKTTSEPVSPKPVPEPEKTVAPVEPQTVHSPEAGKTVKKVLPPPIPTVTHTDTISRVETAVEKEAPKESQDWFSKVAVWVGSIALLMAGFYMIKYSIDSGWLTPAVRLWLTTGFGALLCMAGLVIGVRSSIPASERIGQALSGAGTACLYFAAYAAVHMYGFLSAAQGFAAMLAVTVLAVGLSLKNGAPVAMMGLVGGFLTPWLMSTGSNDTVMLFSYLFVLFCGAQFLCVRRSWWSLLLFSLIGAYLWSAFVTLAYLGGILDHLEGTLVFVLGICLVNAVWVCLAKPDPLSRWAKGVLVAIRFITWGGGLLQAVLLVLISGFAAVDMLLFAILSVGALSLAAVKEDEFIWAAWLAWAAVSVGALSNAESALWSWLLVPLGLAGLFFAVGHWRGLDSSRAVLWRGLSVAAASTMVPLLYLNREWVYIPETGFAASFWLWMSVISAFLLASAGEHLLRRGSDLKLSGEYSAVAVISLGFGLWTYLPQQYYAHAAAVLLIVSSLYWKWRELGRVGIVICVMVLAWAGWMAPNVVEAVNYFFREVMYSGSGQDGLAILAWLLGIAAIATSFRFNVGHGGGSPGQILNWILGLLGLLGIVAIYQWLDQLCMPEEWARVSIEGGLTTLLAVLSLVSISLAHKWRNCLPASMILAALVAVRVIYLHLADTGAEGESFFLNALLLQFGVPFAVSWIMAMKCAQLEKEGLRRLFQITAMALGFIWATFLVQDYFGGSRIFDLRNTSSEIYTYSVVWLLLTIAYQAIGLIRKQAAMHVGSLILLLVTIGKVFIVDASELEGLYRVLSFLGLGFALIGIGYFYNKVVFARRDAQD